MKLKKEALINILESIKKSILENDSFEGNIQYSCMKRGCGKDEFIVVGNWRIGNSQGQGGMNIIK